MKTALVLLLVVIARFSFADGLVEKTYVCVLKECKADVTGPSVVAGTTTVSVGRVFEFGGYDAGSKHAYMRQGRWCYVVPADMISLIPPGNKDYLEARYLFEHDLKKGRKESAGK